MKHKAAHFALFSDPFVPASRRKAAIAGWWAEEVEKLGVEWKYSYSITRKVIKSNPRRRIISHAAPLGWTEDEFNTGALCRKVQGYHFPNFQLCEHVNRRNRKTHELASR